MAALDADERAYLSHIPCGIRNNRGRPPLMVNEPGLYNLVGASHKPQAKAFDRWVRHEVLPLPPAQRVVPLRKSKLGLLALRCAKILG